MQTIVRVIGDKRGQADMVDHYLAQFAVKASKEPELIEFPSPDADDVAFARDDAHEFRARAETPRAQLGSFGQSPNQANGGTKFVFVNPIILTYRPDGQGLGLWVASPSTGRAPNAESE